MLITSIGRKARRQIKQANTELEKLLNNYDRSSSIDLAKLAKLYFEIHSLKKESSYLKQAVSVAKRNNKKGELEAFLSDNGLKLLD